MAGRMSESGHYPPGTEADPRAPWNQAEGEPCDQCDGAGRWPERNAAGELVEALCARCEGTGNEPEQERDETDASGTPEPWER